MDKPRQKFSSLDDIFNDDFFQTLAIKPTASVARNEEERLVVSFQAINIFFETNKRAPVDSDDMEEFQLFSHLEALRESREKAAFLQQYDRFNLLQSEAIAVEEIVSTNFASLDDILNDDLLADFGDDDEGLFDFKHIPSTHDRSATDFVAQRKPCKDFSLYKEKFKAIQQELKQNKRQLVAFKQENLREGEFYVHNGVVLYLESIAEDTKNYDYKSGSRVRKDGRTRVIFENGTESNLLYRSLYKALIANGKAISKHEDDLAAELLANANRITQEDTHSGYIYILKSLSDKKEIKDIRNLYKIGFSTTTVEERIKNAAQEPTYLMSEVRIVITFKCYNTNTQKLEQLLHRFFHKTCLNVDVFDNDGQRHAPREWFIAPLDIIAEAVELLLEGTIQNYSYDEKTEQIKSKLNS